MKPKANLTGVSKRDRCQTPAYALGPLLPHLQRGWRLWEPAQGEGLLVRALQRQGYRVQGSDVLTGRNFFGWQPGSWDALVTNPPYSIKYEWLARCYELGNPFALLVPVEMLGAATAQAMLAEHGTEIILMDKRVDFKMPDSGWTGGGAQFPVMWLTHGFGIGQQLTFATLRKPTAQQRRERAAGVEQLPLLAQEATV